MKKLTLLTTMAATLFLAIPAFAVDYTSLGDISLGFDGYYRVRGAVFSYDQVTSAPLAKREYRGSTVDYFDMRLRLEVEMKFSEKVRLVTEFNGLRNVVFGRNENGNILSQSVTNTSRRVYPTADATTQTTWFETEQLTDTLEVTRLFGEVKTPVGLLRFGRMPSNWGLGILSNDGNDEDDDHGDTYDRILFATKPGEESPFTLALLYSQLITGDEPQAFEEDAQEVVFAPFYKKDDDFYGLYFMYRHQGKNSTTITSEASALIIDFYGKKRFPSNWYLETELLSGQAKLDVQSSGLFADAVDGFAINGVIKGGFDPEGYRAGLEVGFQLGADGETQVRPGIDRTNPAIPGGTPAFVGDTFSTLGFDADYRVDLIMFREAFAQATATMPFSPAPFKLDDSFGSISNAMYVKLDGDYDISKKLTLNGAFIWGQVVEPDIYKSSAMTPNGIVISDVDIDPNLGFELDASIWYTYKERFRVGGLLGYFASGSFFEDAYDYLGSQMTDENIFTAQTKLYILI